MIFFIISFLHFLALMSIKLTSHGFFFGETLTIRHAAQKFFPGDWNGVLNSNRSFEKRLLVRVSIFLVPFCGFSVFSCLVYFLGIFLGFSVFFMFRLLFGSLAGFSVFCD